MEKFDAGAVAEWLEGMTREYPRVHRDDMVNFVLVQFKDMDAVMVRDYCLKWFAERGE